MPRSVTTTTQHKMVIIILYLHPCQFTTLWEYVYYVTQSGGNVIFMFTAELNAQMDELEALLAATARDNNDNATQNGLVAEIDEIEALLDAPVRNNNNSAQNGTY